MSKLHFVGTLLLLPLLWMNSTQAAVKKKGQKKYGTHPQTHHSR